MPEPGGRIQVNQKIGSAIRAFRRRNDYTIAMFARLIEEQARKLGSSLKIDDAFISRLESAKIASARAEVLTLISWVMGYTDVQQLLALGKAEEFIPTRIGTVHGILSGPLFVALGHLTMPGTAFTSFGFQDEVGWFKPIFSDLGTRSRCIRYIAPNLEVGNEDSTPLESSLKEQWRVGKSRLCAAPEIDALWRANEIDIAAVSRSVFEPHMGRRATREGIIAGTISQSAGAELITLIDPFVVFAAEPPPVEETFVELTQASNFLDKSHDLSRLRATDEIKILCPTGAFTLSELDRLSWVRVKQSRRPLVLEEHSLSSYESFLETALERARETGIAILATWEPFSSYIRSAWDRDVEKRAHINGKLFERTRRCATGTGLKAYIPSALNFSFSVDFSLGALFAAAGQTTNGSFPLDLIIARDYLAKGELASISLRRLFDTLESEILGLREAVDRFSDIIVNSNAPADTFAKRVASRATDSVRLLSKVFDLSIIQTFIALSGAEFGLTFDRSFVNYLWERIPNRGTLPR